MNKLFFPEIETAYHLTVKLYNHSSTIEMKTYVGDECKKVWGVAKAFTEFAHIMTQNLRTRRWLAETFALF